MSRTRLVLAATCTAFAGLLTCACHEPQPPPVPPHPTNPTNGGFDFAFSASVSDASIVREAGPVPPGDAGIGLFDAAPVGPR